MDAKEIVDIVRQSLSKRPPPQGIDFQVMDQGVRQDGNWWYVVVKPTNPNARAYEYNTFLSKAEDEIEKQENIKVLLVPALVD